MWFPERLGMWFRWRRGKRRVNRRKPFASAVHRDAPGTAPSLPGVSPRTRTAMAPQPQTRQESAPGRVASLLAVPLEHGRLDAGHPRRRRPLQDSPCLGPREAPAGGEPPRDSGRKPGGFSSLFHVKQLGTGASPSAVCDRTQAGTWEWRTCFRARAARDARTPGCLPASVGRN